MSEVNQYKNGTFCWAELVAAEADRAKDFYTGLFDWTFSDIPVNEGMVYSMAGIDGRDVGAVYQMREEQRNAGVPTHWASYVSVDDIEDTVKRAGELGASILVEPMDVLDSGRMACLQDPTGAVVSLWQPFNHIGAELVNENGALCWNELATSDTEAAGEFYTELFGWSADMRDVGGMVYTIFMNGDRPAAGMMKIADARGGMHPVWFVYFAAESCDVCVEEAEMLGGDVVNPAFDIPEVGRIAFLQDSQGAVFAVIQLFKEPGRVPGITK